jgi:protocatechuate 3,4-dioxygenase beta subunit
MSRDPSRIDRRTALAALGALGLIACDDGTSSPDAGGGDAASGDGSAASCQEIPDETAGPYLDKNGMIGDVAFHRSDITEGKAGVPLSLTLTVVDAANACAPIANANVEIWHCDADGVYSEYSNNMNAGSTTTTYLRGVQSTDAAGRVTFKTVYPGWYNPRATHIHIQIYSGTTLIKTTQLGFPDAVNMAVYASGAPYSKGQSPTTNDADQVFGNAAGGMGTDGGGHDFQIAAITGDPTTGYVATLPVAIVT